MISTLTNHVHIHVHCVCSTCREKSPSWEWVILCLFFMTANRNMYSFLLLSFCREDSFMAISDYNFIMTYQEVPLFTSLPFNQRTLILCNRVNKLLSATLLNDDASLTWLVGGFYSFPVKRFFSLTSFSS